MATIHHPHLHEVHLSGYIVNGDDYKDTWGELRRAERYNVNYDIEPESDGTRWIEVKVSGRRVTKAGNISKRDTYHYNIFNRKAEDEVLTWLEDNDYVPSDIADEWRGLYLKAPAPTTYDDPTYATDLDGSTFDNRG